MRNILIALLGLAGLLSAQDAKTPAPPRVEVRLQIIRITAHVDGSGHIVFTRGAVHYEHKHWKPPVNVTFDGKPWADLKKTPESWTECSAKLDLGKAWIVERKGRDTIALETTPDGFFLYLCDSPNGSADYEVTLAIPER